MSRSIGFPPRYAALAWVAAMFLAVNLAVRIGLAVFEADPANLAPARVAAIFAIGALYDFAALAYLLVPFGLLALMMPNSHRGRITHAVLVTGLAAAATVGMLFVAVSEGFFWNEFSSRFNFIAVDYLVYTREVLGNIRESYRVWPIVGAIIACALLLFAFGRRSFWRAATADGGHLRARFAATAVVLALPVASFALIGDAPRESVASVSARELAGDGYYEFMRAFRNNDLDYRAFYRMIPAERAGEIARHGFDAPGARTTYSGGANPIERRVVASGAPKPLNVVLVSIESLGADYVESFGGKPGLTPNIDKLAREGLMFTQTYATGLRTVRGLEALTLSVPPTPGHAVPMRKHNTGFQTIGGVLAQHGYEPLYLYGGYSVFDNMREFFGGNGYTVIDRTAIPKDRITHETIWGVADEDIFRQAIREIDSRVAAGHKVFAHVMTTSNHRPFTYPQGRVDLPSGSGRDGAVEYTDWAIGEFIREASKRPWFGSTLFVFVADHTSHGRGRSDLPPENYRIPMVFYAPGIVAPGRVDTLASQIDVAPTLLAMLGIDYTSKFFGQDILGEGAANPRAFIANYLTVGYMKDGVVVELSPKQRVRVLDASSGEAIAAGDPRADRLTDEAVAFYQIASGLLRDNAAAAAGETVASAPDR